MDCLQPKHQSKTARIAYYCTRSANPALNMCSSNPKFLIVPDRDMLVVKTLLPRRANTHIGTLSWHDPGRGTPLQSDLPSYYRIMQLSPGKRWEDCVESFLHLMDADYKPPPKSCLQVYAPSRQHEGLKFSTGSHRGHRGHHRRHHRRSSAAPWAGPGGAGRWVQKR